MVLRNCKAGCFLYDLARLQKMQKCIFSLSDRQTPFSIFSLKKYRVQSKRLSRDTVLAALPNRKRAIYF